MNSDLDESSSINSSVVLDEPLSELDDDDDIVEPFIDNLILEDAIDLDEFVYIKIDEYVMDHLGQMHSNHFHEYLIQDSTLEIFELLLDMDLVVDDETHYQELLEFVKIRATLYFESISQIPYRQQTLQTNQHQNLLQITEQIEYLRAIPQPVQRTKEWYEFRYNLITASNLGKLFSSESQYNSLICEKCKPLDYASSLGHCGTESSLHWGTKYEPLTILLYEKIYATKIEDFGCIRHSRYSCIGASPDGINIDPQSSRYGRMLEVKNIVNREITGIPLDAYWIQMQIQMETCNLDVCDFAETRFKEYEEADFYADTREHRGIILYFVKKTARIFNNDGKYNTYNVPHYVYMPLHIELTKEAVERWTAAKKEELKSEYTLYIVQYWYLDQFSCIVVERNREWFQLAVGKIEEAWKTVEKERISGWDHRLPKKKQVQPIVLLNDDTLIKPIKNLTLPSNFCLIKLE